MLCRSLLYTINKFKVFTFPTSLLRVGGISFIPIKIIDTRLILTFFLFLLALIHRCTAKGKSLPCLKTLNLLLHFKMSCSGFINANFHKGRKKLVTHSLGIYIFFRFFSLDSA